MTLDDASMRELMALLGKVPYENAVPIVGFLQRKLVEEAARRQEEHRGAAERKAALAADHARSVNGEARAAGAPHEPDGFEGTA